MKYHVDIPPHVENQILDHALYIANDSIQRAIDWSNRIRQQIEALSDWPKAYGIDPVSYPHDDGPMRKRSLGNYIVRYRVIDLERLVKVVDFRHAARQADPPSDKG